MSKIGTMNKITLIFIGLFLIEFILGYFGLVGLHWIFGSISCKSHDKKCVSWFEHALLDTKCFA